MLPVEPEGGTPAMPREFVVAGISRPAQPWTLRLFPDGLRLAPQREGVPPIHLLRAEVPTYAQLLDFGVTRRTLAVRKPVKRAFKLDPPAWSALTEWVGRDTRLRMALRQRLGYGVPLGLLVLATSIPLSGDPEAGIPAVPFDPLAATLGTLLVASALLARWRPHPVLFLVDSAWFAALAASIVVRVAFGDNPLWLILVVLQLLLVWSGLSLYRDLRRA